MEQTELDLIKNEINNALSVMNFLYYDIDGDSDTSETASANAPIIETKNEFEGMKLFNGYWKISGTTASKVTSKSYLANDFFPLPKGNYLITSKNINGYNVGFRFYISKTLEGTTPDGISKSNAYGTISGAKSQSVNMDEIKKIDKEAKYFSIAIWVKTASGTSNMSLTNKTFEEFLDIKTN